MVGEQYKNVITPKWQIMFMVTAIIKNKGNNRPIFWCKRWINSY
jgi:hypothetical protein